MKLPQIDPIRYAWETMSHATALPVALYPFNYGVNRILETAAAHRAIRAKRAAARKAKQGGNIRKNPSAHV